MIKSFKNRIWRTSEYVWVYRNLTKNSFSIMQYGKVVAHGTYFSIIHCRSRVNNKGIDRIRQRKHKEVCAYLGGYLCEEHVNKIPKNTIRVKFNPYKDASFDFECCLKCYFSDKEAFRSQ